MSGLGEVLRAAGMWVEIAPAGVRCLEQIHSRSPDVVLVEFGEPDTTALVRDLLETSKRPGILYVVDALAGLADVDRLCLADDHVRLDYGPAELVLRLEVLVARRKSSTCGARFQAGRVRIDRDAREVLAGGRPVSLSVTDFELLRSARFRRSYRPYQFEFAASRYPLTLYLRQDSPAVQGLMAAGTALEMPRGRAFAASAPVPGYDQ